MVWDLRTEGGGPAREASAIGLGVAVGCSPFYGLHLLICWGLGWLLRLNRLKMYLAANVSNPLAAPLLILAELQAGAWIRRGRLHALDLETVRAMDPWVFGADLLIGSAVVGATLGTLAGLATYMARGSGTDPWFADLVRRASDRYVTASITAWEFARVKLRGDPVYRMVLTGTELPSGGTLVDVGCGQGLMLALLAEAEASWAAGRWPSDTPPPPRFDRLVGIEHRPNVASIARRALGDAATIIEGDARRHTSNGCRAVLFLDVLHLMPREDQERLLASMAAALDPSGVMLVREADAGAGWRFATVTIGNRAKALMIGRWKQTFHFRTAADWLNCFARLGFSVGLHGAAEGTPFANLLFVLTRRDAGSSLEPASAAHARRPP
jgi:uncharacterized protein (DUF2062 family)